MNAHLPAHHATNRPARPASLWVTLAAVMACSLGPARAADNDSQPPSVDTIVHRANLVSYYQGHTGRAQVEMTITDAQGRQRHRQFTILRRDARPSDKPDQAEYWCEQKFYVFFHKPADVARTVFMVHKHLDRDDDRWLYLPALDLVKRIAAADKRTSFMGSDFYYEDVSGRSLDLDKHELLQTTTNYYVLKHTPKNPDTVEFSHYIMYVHKATFIPVQTIYYDKKGQKYRVYTALKVQTIQDYPTVTQASMENLKTGSKTVMSYSQVTYNLDLPDEIFTERYLRKPPTNYLQ